MYTNVHTPLKQSKEPEPVVSYCAGPVPRPGPVPIPSSVNTRLKLVALVLKCKF